MQRLTISMSDAFAAELEEFMASHGYDNRSEAVRDLARLGLERARLDAGTASQAVAILTYVYDHEMRELSRRLTGSHHRHHDLGLATLHVHLDHDQCLEVAVLRGSADAIKQFAQTIIAERGVRHGQMAFVPVNVTLDTHAHDEEHEPHPHLHTHSLP